MMSIAFEIKEIVGNENQFPWWEICLGLSNLILAAIVAWSTFKNSKKDRKVHISDKRMEWIHEFRNLISEVLNICALREYGHQSANDKLNADNYNLSEEDDYKVNLIKNKLYLLCPQWDEDIQLVISNIDKLMRYDIAGKTEQEFRKDIRFIYSEILIESQNMINIKWQKIKRLED